MKVVADFHLHSKYSRATSKDITIPNMIKYCGVKGIGLVGTGDFTHPKWFNEIKEHLVEDGSGFLKPAEGPIRFVLSGEISLMYSQGGHGRRVHFVLLAPSLAVAEQMTEWLKKRGRVDYDGRPIFGFSAPEFTEAMMGISKDIMLIPAHAWTPWFGILGEKSGFNSVEECFCDQTKNIHALETGLSSDPAMNWRVSSLDKFALVSNSDSHSLHPWRLGREANVFSFDDLTYRNFTQAIIKKDPKHFLYTIEVDPSYGKYHYDGHRACNVRFSPEQSKKHNNICPVCGKPLIIGVLHRVEELADRPEGFVPKGAIPFRTVLPLSELLAAVYDTTAATKKVMVESEKLIKEFGTELNVILDAPEDRLRPLVHEKVLKALVANRAGKIKIEPGYDGLYGTPVI